MKLVRSCTFRQVVCLPALCSVCLSAYALVQVQPDSREAISALSYISICVHKAEAAPNSHVVAEKSLSKTVAMRVPTRSGHKGVTRSQVVKSAINAFCRTQSRRASHALKEFANSGSPVIGQLKSVRVVPFTGKSPKTNGAAVSVCFEPEVLDAELLKSAGSDYKAVLLLPEFSNNVILQDSRVETAVAVAMQERGFTIYDTAFVARDNPLSALAVSAETGTPPVPDLRLGSWYCANWVILGRVACSSSELPEGLVSCRSHCDARAVNLITGLSVAIDSFDSVGVSDTADKARDVALKHLAVAMATVVPDKIIRCLPKHEIRFDTAAIPSEKRVAILELLRKQPGVVVSSVKEHKLEQAGGISAITTDRPEAIAVQLGIHVPDLEFYPKPAALTNGVRR